MKTVNPPVGGASAAPTPDKTLTVSVKSEPTANGASSSTDSNKAGTSQTVDRSADKPATDVKQEVKIEAIVKTEPVVSTVTSDKPADAMSSRGRHENLSKLTVFYNNLILVVFLLQ